MLTIAGFFSTKAFQSNLLAVDYETFLYTFRQRHRRVCQAVCRAAAFACKMRMALNGPAIMRKFKSPCPVLQIRLVYQAGVEQALKHPVDRNLIQTLFAQLRGDLVLAQRCARPR